MQEVVPETAVTASRTRAKSARHGAQKVVMGEKVTRSRRDRLTPMGLELLGPRTVIAPAPDLAAAAGQGVTLHTAPTEVGDGIVTASVRTPQGSVVGVIVNSDSAAT